MSHEPGKIRNVAVVGHRGTGKTSLVEAMLFQAGATNRLGAIEAGSTVSDWDEDEQKRSMSLSGSLIHLEWQDRKINLVDTPGDAGFQADTLAALRVIEGALVVLSGVMGVEVNTSRVWARAEEYELSRVVFVNMLDRERADFFRILHAAREQLLDAVVETDEELMARYLEGEELPVEDVAHALKDAVTRDELYPVGCGVATKNLGTTALLDLLVEGVPSPAKKGTTIEFGDAKQAVFVFKTIADPFAGRISCFRVLAGPITGDTTLVDPRTHAKERVGQILLVSGKDHTQVDSVGVGDLGAVAKLKDVVTGDVLVDHEVPVEPPHIDFPEAVMSFAITPKAKGDEEKMAAGLRRLSEEDPTLSMRRDRQTGGRGQFGDCSIVIEPLEEREGYEFVDKIVGGVIPQSFRPAVDKGIQEAMQHGELAGAPVQGVRVQLVDGQHHTVDSSEMAFKIAGSMAFKEAYAQADPVLLEPIMELEATVPDETVGAVNGDLNSRRGRLLGMDPHGGMTTIKAEVPMAEVLTYSQSLTSLTGGRGDYSMHFVRYEEVPSHIAQKVIAENQKEKEEAKV